MNRTPAPLPLSGTRHTTGFPVYPCLEFIRLYGNIQDRQNKKREGAISRFVGVSEFRRLIPLSISIHTGEVK